MRTTFQARYGAWAVVAGASEGLGAAFAEALCARGMNTLLLARRAALLEQLATTLRARHAVEVRTRALDLASDSLDEALREATRGLEVGLGVYNAAYSTVGPLLETPLDELLRVVDVNVRGPLRFAHALAPAMVSRRRGALVFMSSIAGFQGSPRIATYAASKAFATVLGEGLWGELRAAGVDVLVTAAGAIRTPNYLRAAKAEAPGTLDARDVAEASLEALGRGPTLVPGAVNKLASALLGRAMPRALSVSIMGKNTQELT